MAFKKNWRDVVEKWLSLICQKNLILKSEGGLVSGKFTDFEKKA
jgi:hypothetical protein